MASVTGHPSFPLPSASLVSFCLPSCSAATPTPRPWVLGKLHRLSSNVTCSVTFPDLSTPASHEQFFLLPCSRTLCSPFTYCSHQLVALLFASCVCLSWQTVNSTLTASCLKPFIYGLQFGVLCVAKHIGDKSFGLEKCHCWNFSPCVKNHCCNDLLLSLHIMKSLS